MSAPALTLADVARRAASRLRDAGFAPDEAARETGVLARAWLGWDQARWVTRAAAPAPAAFAAGLDDWVARRAAREPSAYITGRREFYGRDFQVTRAVLIPRPETEAVVEAALRAIDAITRRPDDPPSILDVGTGSGCLAVTLALERPDVTVAATDVSIDALAVAAANADTHGVAARVRFLHAPLAGGATGRYDVIVANPPYCSAADQDALAPEVRDFEPALALFAGPDGLDVLRALTPAAGRALRAGGSFICEIGRGQAEPVATLVTSAGLRLTAIEPDLAGIPRVVIADAPPV